MSDSADPNLVSAYAHCEAEVRAADYDRWLSGLFAPAALRPHLYALYAYSLEVARVRDIVSEPMLGEVRHQWWRDAINGQARGAVGGNPVAAAVLDTMARFKLPAKALVDLIDARSFDLYDDPMPTQGDLEGYCGETSSILMRLGAIVLTEGDEPKGADAVGHAGVAYAMTGLLRALPWHEARGQVYLPADVLERHGLSRSEIVAGYDAPNTRAALGELRQIIQGHHAAALAAAPSLTEESRAVLLPLALVPLYLRQMEKPDYAPFKTLVEAPSWRRLWAMWRLSKAL